MPFTPLTLSGLLALQIASAAPSCPDLPPPNVPPPGGKHYYVAPGGVVGTCSEVRPCRELESAIPMLRPGDTVHLADGVYKGFVITGLKGTQEKPILLVADGKQV